MSEYYAIIRSTDHLAHYGVKGMKWGVRKAIEKGNTKRLDRNYKKAAKKLAKLNEYADVTAQTAKANKLNKYAKIQAKVGLAGLGALGAMAGAHYGSKLAGATLLKKKGDAESKYQKAFYDGNYIAKSNYREAADHYGDLADKAWDVHDKLRSGGGIRTITAGVTAGALGSAAIDKLRAIDAKQRTTAKGHAKAVAERDAWKKEMNKAFSGTKYQGQYAVPSKQKKRRK